MYQNSQSHLEKKLHINTAQTVDPCKKISNTTLDLEVIHEEPKDRTWLHAPTYLRISGNDLLIWSK